MAASGVLLLVLKVAALLGKGEEVGEDHAAEANVVVVGWSWSRCTSRSSDPPLDPHSS